MRLALAVGAMAALVSAPVFAEENRYNIHLELGPLITLDQPGGFINQRVSNLGMHVRLGFEWSFFDWLGADAGWEPNVLFAEQGGTQTMQQHVYVGVRFRPWHNARGGYLVGRNDDNALTIKELISDVWFDVHPALVFGDATRFGFDIGAGARVAVLSPLQVGIYVRYEYMLGLDMADDPNFQQFTAGVTLSAGFQPIIAEADSDGDGVPDSRDKCAGTRAGATVNAKGCEVRAIDSSPPRCGDTDLDGVCDGEDNCPDTPLGTRVDKHGCPSESGTTPADSAPPADKGQTPAE